MGRKKAHATSIINNFDPKSPIYVRHETPTFRTKLEAQRYWAEEKRRWIEGYQGLPGTFYHSVQEQVLKDRVSGKIARPLVRDADLWIHEAIEQSRKARKALFIVKGRGLGLTSIGAGSLPNYFMRVNPGSTILMTSHEQAKIMTMFQQKTLVTFEGYHTDIRVDHNKINANKQSCYLNSYIPYIDDDGNEQLGLSEIFCKETSDSESSATGFSGTGAIYGFYDEAGIHKRIKKLLQSSVECYRNPSTGQLDGFLLLGGTIEDTLKPEEIAAIAQLINDASIIDMDVLFCPAWWGKFMDENGWSNEQKGREWWEKEVERLSKIEDQSYLTAFRKNNPMSKDDIFELGKGSMWEDDVKEKIILQTKELSKNPPAIGKYTIVELGGEITASPDKSSPIEILEPPKPGISYYELIDGVATGTNVGSETGSSVSGMIVKMFDPDGDSYSPVALYYERPKTIEDSYIKLANLAMHYNKFGGFQKFGAEANAGNADHFSTFLTKRGLAKYIAKKKDLSGKGHVNTKKNFTYVTSDVRDFQIRQANIFLRKYVHHFKMVKVLNDLLKAATENADIRDSWLMFFVTVPMDFDKPYVKPKDRYKERVIMTKDSQGRTTWQTIKIKIE